MKTEPNTVKILIVDDEPVEVALLENVLRREGYQISSAAAADRGLQMAMDNGPDMIILDVMMPLINGFNFCQLIKNQEDSKHIKIIMVTARDEMEDIEIGMEMGADAYLTKPINTQELLRTIQVVQSNSRHSDQPHDN
ncbi:MAG: response regulator [Candidatus Omnitrophica bacterium]|nr:response regulator [Candidatus Omnitrophota bacterium]